MSSSQEYLVQPVSGPIVGSVRPPGSKSLTNRALIVAALANGTSKLTGVLASRDTEVMIDSLRKLGVSLEQDLTQKSITITGCGGKPAATAANLYLENSGTSIRFLTALCTLGQGQYRLSGNARMHERPISDLADALNQLGAKVTCQPETKAPPLQVEANGLTGGKAEVNTGLSSQYLSALLMAAPGARQPVEIVLTGPLVSEPYIDMTMGVMARFGVTVDHAQPRSYVIAPQTYTATHYDIEPDASAASYFFAMAAITGGKVTVEGLSRYALQGDIHFVDSLEKMGCLVDWQSDSVTVQGRPLKGIDIDMNAISDTAQTLAAVAVYANGPTTIRHVEHMRFKETDRIAAVTNELRRLGQTVEEFKDGLTITPMPVTPASVETYDDHRMAMSFALVGLKTAGVRIQDPGCTAKTYPHYFQDLEAICNGSSS